MESRISKAIGLKHSPVALTWSDQKPKSAIQFQEGKGGCLMGLVAAAAKGKDAICDRKTTGCLGGGVGVGFGNQYKNFPGGEDCYCYFLSTGNEQWDKGRAVAQEAKPYMPQEFYEDFLRGGHYIKSPGLVKKFVESLPMVDIPAKYVVFKPLKNVDKNDENPQVIIFFADADQLSALVLLANYAREDNDNVIIPFAAGCQSIGIYPYQEAKAAKQRAVVGLTDVYARLYTRKQLGDGIMTFSVPPAMFEEMEANVEGSFLEHHVWQSILEGKEVK